MSKRASGVLMHITSLPTPGGTGTLGREAYDFVDRLKRAGFGIWQVLPVGLTGYGDSHYQSASVHAGNPLMIALKVLKDEGLLDVIPERRAPTHDEMKQVKMQGLRLSFNKSFDKLRWVVSAFISEHPGLGDYALFMAIKDYFGGKSWTEWPDESIRIRQESAIKEYTRLLRENVDFYEYVQYLFYRQWGKLRTYANSNGIKIMGDMPIYVAEDSADCWANPEIFQLDADRRPVKVAGVPPDYFSSDGQLWGNPLYNWKALRKRHFDWWLDRFTTADELFDIVRLDHFIGFANYYAVKAGAKTARIGKWEKAPGFALFKLVNKNLPELKIVAEDLGVVSRRVKRLLRYCGYPGMRVLQFGFNSIEENPHFIHNIVPNCVLYSGTHDNDTAKGWWADLDEETRELFTLNMPDGVTVSESMIQAALESPADIAIVPMQDILGLGKEARMNVPGTVGGSNWLWRMEEGAFTEQLIDDLRYINDFSGRSNDD